MNIRFVLLALVILGLVAMSHVSGVLAVSVLIGRQPPSVVQPYQYLTSVNKQYSFVMRPDCNLVIYNFSQSLLATHITAPATPNCSLWMQDDGNLVIYNFTSTTNQTRDLVSANSLWAVNAFDTINGSRSFLLLGGDGTFDFFNTNGTLRQTRGNTNLYNTSRLYLANDTEFSYPNWTSSEPKYKPWKPDASLDGFPYMPAEYFLSANKSLLTVNGVYALELGTDCNLQSKQYSFLGGSFLEVLWESGTLKDGRTCELKLQSNGILQILDVNSSDIYWSSPGRGNSDGNWILKVNPDNGSLIISDIQNSSHILWTNESGSPPSGLSTALIAGVFVGVVVGAFVLTLAAWWLYSFARERILDPSERAFQARLRAKGGTSYAFSQAKVKKATKNYENAIGRGGFGKVYKGKLPDGQEVAAKVMTSANSQSKEMFYNEIELLSMVHHKFLVSLIGYSCTRTHQVLIYEFMAGGDLRHRLQGESGAGNPLSWRQRTSIILQVSEGLEYLHDKCSPPIIHRDVKSENILLTDKLVAKVADFGLSKLKAIGKEDDTHISTAVKGTPGYLDPEYHETGMLTDKSDVYAFGVVLMEIFTGRPPTYIIQIVSDAWRQNQLGGLADPNLGEDFDRDELKGLVELALWCVRRSNGDRPYMRDVMRRLRELLSTKLPQPPLEFEEDDRRREMYSTLMPLESEDSESETRPLSQSSSINMHSEGLIRQRSYRSRSHQPVTVLPDTVQ